MSYCKREGMFETNSSSTHAVAIKGGKYEPDLNELRPDAEGVVRVYPDEFGWGPENHYDARTKASYLMTWCKEMNDEFNEKILKYVIKETTGAKEVMLCAQGGESPWGYIDHQSLDSKDNAGAEVFRGGADAVKDFIFNQKSFLVIDNDNH